METSKIFYIQKESFSKVSNIIDQYSSIHLKSIIIRDHMEDFEMVKTWWIEDDRDILNL